MSVRILIGDCRDSLTRLPDCSVHCCVTSPPYFNLRDYGHAGQIGLEKSPAAFVAALVEVFREVRRVLREDGTLWLNLGDSYGKGKQLIGIPWRVALALQEDGWILRNEVIWNKPNPKPDPAKDRLTPCHETIFLFAKSRHYYFDAEAISEEAKDWSRGGPGTGIKKTAHYGADNGGNSGFSALAQRYKDGTASSTRNKRTVWTVAAMPVPDAHFAVYPPELIEPCITASCPRHGTVLDPFGGAGTTGLVAHRQHKQAILCELNPDYAAIMQRRLADDGGMFMRVEIEP